MTFSSNWSTGLLGLRESLVGNAAGAHAGHVSPARWERLTEIPVLILGENGTGKELIARAIHTHSKRRKNRLVTMNCAGFAPTILEDEMFGHVRGAYTGANTDREGRFEHADHGTPSFLTIRRQPHDMQAGAAAGRWRMEKWSAWGRTIRLKVDVRIISATNQNLDEMVKEKQFRQDLLYRINGVSIQIPPLRERREDIPLLLHYFMSAAAEKYGKQIEGLEPDAQQVLMSYSWPGNVRQLRNAVESAVALAPGPKVTIRDLPADIRPAGGDVTGGMNNLVGISIQQAERELIRNTLKLTAGNREQAAKILEIGERTLYRKIKEYEL